MKRTVSRDEFRDKWPFIYSYLDGTISFVCKICNRWYEYGHDEDCPLKEVKEPKK